MKKPIESLEKDAADLRGKLEPVQRTKNSANRSKYYIKHKLYQEKLWNLVIKTSNIQENIILKLSSYLKWWRKSMKIGKKYLQRKGKCWFRWSRNNCRTQNTRKKVQPRPIIDKVLNTNIKARVMKKRPDVIELWHGLKLVDEVTRPNTELITTLLKHPEVTSAWYFNWSIFVKLSNERRVSLTYPMTFTRKCGGT